MKVDVDELERKARRAGTATITPPVVLALIARIRELEETLEDASDLAADHDLFASAVLFAEIVRKGAVLP